MSENKPDEFRTPLEYQFLRKTCIILAGLWAGTVVAGAVAMAVVAQVMSSNHAKALASAVNAIASAVK